MNFTYLKHFNKVLNIVFLANLMIGVKVNRCKYSVEIMVCCRFEQYFVDVNKIKLGLIKVTLYSMRVSKVH